MRTGSRAWGLGLAMVVVLGGCYAPTVDRNRPYHPSDADLSITRIVHGSVILDFGTTRILVDPWFSPAPPLGPRETIGIALDQLPSMRGILITHRHTDHFDRETLAEYPNKQARVVAVRGLGRELLSLGFADVVEVEAWEETQIGNVRITAVPARHASREVGYVLRGGGLTAYVAGDTRFDREQFRAIASAFPEIDVALLPIGGVRIFGRKLDMSPRDAARAMKILGARTVIPVHYGLTGPFPFVLSASDPIADLRAELERGGGPKWRSVVVLEPGESWHHYR